MNSPEHDPDKHGPRTVKTKGPLPKCAAYACFEAKRTPDGESVVVTRVINGDQQIGTERTLNRGLYEALATLTAFGMPVRILAAPGEARGSAGLSKQQLREEARGFRRALWNPENPAAPLIPAALAKTVTVFRGRSSQPTIR